MKIDKFFKCFQSTRKLAMASQRINSLVETLMSIHEAHFKQRTTTSCREPNPFLDLFYTLRDTMTYQQTVEGFLMFFGAGFDTTGKALSSVLLLLAMNPKEQEKVHNEISTILSSEANEVDEEKLAKMVYLDLVIKESLRLLPQSLGFAREAINDVKLSELKFWKI
jgi:cytochrome P450